MRKLTWTANLTPNLIWLVVFVSVALLCDAALAAFAGEWVNWGTRLVRWLVAGVAAGVARNWLMQRRQRGPDPDA